MNRRMAYWRPTLGFVLATLIGMLGGCSQSPSSSGVAAGDDAQTVETLDDPSPVPLGPPVDLAETGLPKVDAGNLQVADSNVLVLLKGALETRDEEPPEKITWTQVSGPPVRIANPEGLTGAIVVPDLTEPAQLRFKLAIWQTAELKNAAATTVMVQPQDSFARVVGGYAPASEINGQFTIRLSSPQNEPVEIFYRTVEESATAYVDFIPIEGSVRFAAGETEKTVPIQLLKLAENDSFRSLSLQIHSFLEADEFVNRGVLLIEQSGQPGLDQAITFAQPELAMRTGEVILADLDQSDAPGAGDVYFISQRPAVASIDAAGMITGNNSGETVISAYKAADEQYRGAVASFDLRVSTDGEKLQTVSFAVPEAAPILIDETFSNPLLVLDGTDNPIAYSVNDPSLATVDDEGTVAPLAPGRVTVNARVAGDVIFKEASASYFLDIEQYPLALNLFVPSLGQTLESGAELALVPGQVLDLVLVEDSRVRPPEYELDVFESGEALGQFSVQSSATGVVSAHLETRLAASPATGDPAYLGLTLTSIAEGTAEITITRAADFWYPQTQMTLYVSAAPTPAKPQAIAFADAGPLTVTAGDSLTNPLVNEGQGSGVIRYASSDTSVATVDNQASVQTQLAGQVTITATKAGDQEFLPASAEYRLLVNLAPQSLVFTYPQGDNVEVGETYFNPLDPTLSSAPGTAPLAYSSSQPSIASVDGQGLVTALTPGEVTISVRKATDGRYASASASYPLTVAAGLIEPIAQTLVFELLGDLTLTLGTTLANPVNLVASDAPGSGAIGYSSSHPEIASVDAAGLVQALALGTATITATKLADGVYAEASSDYEVRVVAPDPLPQTLVFSFPGAATLEVGDSFTNPIDEAASTAPGSGVLRYESSDSMVARVDASGTVTALSSGTTTIIASKAGDDLYQAAQASYSITVTALDNQLIFAIAGATELAVGATLANPATSTGGNSSPIVYESSAPAVVAVDSSGFITALAAGFAEITARQAADDRVGAASASYRLTVSLAENRLSFPVASPDPVYVAATLANPAQSNTASSGLIRYVSSNPAAVTVDADGLATAVAVGAATITATQAADGQFASAAASYSLSVILTPQQLVFSVPGTAELLTGESRSNPIDGEASSAPGSGELTYESSNPTVASVDDQGTVTALAPGNAIITASKLADAVFDQARATYSVTVRQPLLIAQTLVFSAPEDVTLAVDQTYANPVDAEASNAPGSGVVSYSSSDEGVALVDAEGTVTTLAPGLTTIVASKAADERFDQASISYQVRVTQGANQLVFALPDPESVTATTSLANPATASSPNTSPIVYASSAPDVATVDENGLLSALIAGETTITATQASDGRYLQASASYSVTVTLAAQQLVFTLDPVATLTPGQTLANPIDETASDAPGSGAITYVSSAPAVVTVDSTGQITALLPGTAVISANKAADAVYGAASASYPVAVAAIEQNLVFSVPGDIAIAVDERLPNPVDLQASNAPGSGAIRYSSSDTMVVTVEGDGTLTGVVPGVATITANKAGDPLHNPAAASYTVTVSAGANQLQFALAQPGPLVAGGAFLDNPASSTSASTGAISYATSSAEVATVDADGRVTAGIAGSVTITASQAADGRFEAAQASYPLEIVRRQVQLVFTDPGNPVLLPGETFNNPIDPSASGIGSATVLYQSSNPNVADVTGAGQLIAATAGTTVVTATLIEDDLVAGAQASYSVTVEPIDQQLVFLQGNLANLEVGEIWRNPVDEQASDAPGSGAITYVSSASGIASVDQNGSVSANAFGVATVTATKAGDAVYAQASASFQVNVRRIANTVFFDLEGGLAMLPGDTSGNALVATTNSTGAIGYSSSNTDVASVDATTGLVTAVAPGTAVITGTQAATDLFAEASASYPVQVRLGNNLTFADPGPVIMLLGDTLQNPAQSSANSAGSISYRSANADVASVSDTGLVTAVEPGTAMIFAAQQATATVAAGTGSYIVLVRLENLLSFAVSDEPMTVGDVRRYDAVSVYQSDGPITYGSSNPAVARIESDGRVTALAPGTSVITASQAATTLYAPASITTEVTVVAATNSLRFANPGPIVLRTGTTQTNTAISATQSNGTISYRSSDATVASVDASGTVTGAGVGDATIFAEQAAAGIYPSASASYQVQVRRENFLLFEALTLDMVTNESRSNQAYSVPASTGAMSYRSSNMGVIQVNSKGVVSAVAPGTATITATQAMTDEHLSASRTAEVVVRRPNTIAFESPLNYQILVDSTMRNLAVSTQGSDGPIFYSSDNSAIARVNASTGLVTGVAPGNTRINAWQDVSDEFGESATISFGLSVRARQTLALASASTTLTTRAAANIPFAASTQFLSGMSAIVASSGNANVATAGVVVINGENVLRIVAQGVGATVIRLTRAANDTYATASTTIRVTVEPLIF